MFKWLFAFSEMRDISEMFSKTSNKPEKSGMFLGKSTLNSMNKVVLFKNIENLSFLMWSITTP